MLFITIALNEDSMQSNQVHDMYYNSSIKNIVKSNQVHDAYCNSYIQV